MRCDQIFNVEIHGETEDKGWSLAFEDRMDEEYFF